MANTSHSTTSGSKRTNDNVTAVDDDEQPARKRIAVTRLNRPQEKRTSATYFPIFTRNGCKMNSSDVNPFVNFDENYENDRNTLKSPNHRADFKTVNNTTPFASPAVGSTSRSVGAKKLLIKNLKSPTSPTASSTSSSSFTAQWQPLSHAIDAIHECRAVDTSLELLYQIVGNVCAGDMAKQLYEALAEACARHVQMKVGPLLEARKLDHTGNDAARLDTESYFLKKMCETWTKHCDTLTMVRSVFLYLDRTYVLQNTQVLSIWELGMTQYRTTIMDNVDIARKTIECVLALIASERHGGKVDTQSLHTMRHMFTSLMIYEAAFEKPVLEATVKLYESEGQRLIKTLDVPAYLNHVRTRLDEEQSRAIRYMDESRSAKQMTVIVQQQMLEPHVEVIVSNGMDKLLSEQDVNGTKLMYELLGTTTEGRKLMRQTFSGYIKKQGKIIVMDVAREKSMVDDMLTLKRSMDGNVKECFDKDTRFGQCVKDAFDTFINQRQNKPAEMIAKYMDSKLRAGNKDLSDDSLEKTMDELVILFRFVHGKDVFEAFYKKDLAKRLLLGRSASVDAEKAMLTKLKAECGAAFTSKLEGMFKDMELSREMMPGFRKFVSNLGEKGVPTPIKSPPTATTENDDEMADAATVDLKAIVKPDEGAEMIKTLTNAERTSSTTTPSTSTTPAVHDCPTKLSWPAVDLNVNVLTLGTWPTYTHQDVHIPAEMAEFQQVFTKFYMGKHSGRKLQWQPSLGQVVMKARFGDVEKELQVSLFQSIVLLLFNERDELNYETIAHETNIEEGELKRTLQSLACGKFRPLLKTPKGKEIENGDTFKFNHVCNDKLYRIRISQVQMRETEEERIDTEEQVFADRQYAIDAAIVRIMKSRKSFSHTLLVTELIAQLRFPTRPADLKKRIESLIDRDYLVRDKDNPNTYNYVA